MKIARDRARKTRKNIKLEMRRTWKRAEKCEILPLDRTRLCELLAFSRPDRPPGSRPSPAWTRKNRAKPRIRVGGCAESSGAFASRFPNPFAEHFLLQSELSSRSRKKFSKSSTFAGRSGDVLTVGTACPRPWGHGRYKPHAWLLRFFGKFLARSARELLFRILGGHCALGRSRKCLFQCPPGESRALDTLGKPPHCCEDQQIAKACRWVARLRSGKHVSECLDGRSRFVQRLAAHFDRHDRGGRHADCAAMTLELEILDHPGRESYCQLRLASPHDGLSPLTVAVARRRGPKFRGRLL